MCSQKYPTHTTSTPIPAEAIMFVSKKLARKTVCSSNSLELLGNSGDLLHAVLMGGKIRLERLVLLLQGLELVELALPEVLRREHLLFTAGPVLMSVGLVLELLSQMLEPLEPHHLREQPVLERLLRRLQALPGLVDVRDHFALGRHVGRSVAQPELGLQRVEVGLEFGLLLDARRLVLAPVGAVLLELLLAAGERVVGLAAVQPGHGASDPFEQIRGQALVLLHEALVLLVDLQHLADPVCRCLGLRWSDG